LSSWNLHAEDCAFPEILVQDDRSDWDFIKFISRKYGWRLFPDAASDSVVIGYASSDDVKTVPKESVADMTEDCFYFNGSSYKRIHCTLNQYLTLGETVSFGDEHYVVDTVIIRRVHNTYEMQYQLEQYPLATERLKYDFMLQAAIVSNEDPEKKGKCQVTFQEDAEADRYDDVMKDNPVWIDTATFFASGKTGISFLPEKDDVVLVQIKNGRGLIASSVRRNSFGDTVQDYDYNRKYLFFRNDRFIEINEDEAVYNTSKFRISLSDKRIQLDWDEKIHVALSDGRIAVSNNDTVKYELTDKAFTLESQKSALSFGDELKLKAGKNVQIDGDSRIDMKASKINIDGDGGVSIN
jgi:hypothetical protein